MSTVGGEEVVPPGEDDQASLELPLRRDVASTVSAPGVIRFATSAVATMGLVVAGEPAPTCPRLTGTLRVGTIEGGCTDARGNRIDGRVRFDSTTDIATYEFEGWQLDRFRIDGTIRARSSRRADMSMQQGPAQPRPSADDDWWIDIEAYAPLGSNLQAALAPSAEEASAGTPEQQHVRIRMHYEASKRDKVYEGRGTFSIGGFGSFRAETHAEVVDNDICSSEAASGETILSTDDDRVRILYDGATDCDPTSTVIVERGAERRELAGVQCSAGGRASPWAWLALLALLRKRGFPRADQVEPGC